MADKKTGSFVTSLPSFRKEVAQADRFTLSPSPSNKLATRVVSEEEVTASSQETTTKTGFVSKGRLYAGLLLGPDISSVKFQKTEGVGYNLGLFLGYRLSSKWQLESGILLNRKEYYSDGYYFKTDHTYLPTHSTITKVDGYCTMFEVPLNIRYNIIQKKQANWYAVAGVSSYLMNKEDYNYTYKRYNREYSANKVYRNGSKDWLAAVNASIGYEKAINKKIQIRLEPYLKLPLQGMGTGKLPISSAGMNIGVSYPIK
jgi:Outer membrane protein beta-barrel domain